MELSILSLLPPVLVLFLGITTQRVLFSLLCGIASAGVIATKGNLLSALSLIFSELWETSELANITNLQSFLGSESLLIFLFLANLGVIVVLLSKSGGALAYTQFVKRYLHDKKSVQSASLLLSKLLFIDDYFNALTVGTVMHPLTDEYKVPRAKLAYLVDSLSAPLSILVPVSSWVAVIIGPLHKTGVSLVSGPNTLITGDPFAIYLKAIPFTFYSFLTIFSAWLIVRYSLSFGAMKTHEDIAEQTGNLFGGKAKISRRVEICNTEHGCSLIDFILPVSTLILSVIGVLLYTGGSSLFGGSNNILTALQQANSYMALAFGSIIALVTMTLFLLARRRIKTSELGPLYHEGSLLMAPAIIILLLSWTLGGLLKNYLFTGQYLAHALIGSVSLIYFPAMFFIASGLTSFAMGSSWGTLAIMIPIAIPMIATFASSGEAIILAQQVPVLYPVLGAILSGAVFGDHISPISDTTIMTSTSTGSHHIDHVRTQFTYAIPVFFAATLSFFISGYLLYKTTMGLFANGLISITIGIASLVLTLFIRTAFAQKRDHAVTQK